MERKNVFVTAKAYPVESRKYDEVVCTAGITDKGELIRIYPIPFRKLRENLRYAKYQWISIDVEKRASNLDCRKESYRCDTSSLQLGEIIDSSNWNERMKLFVDKTEVFTDINKLYDASDRTKKNFISLAVFKPSNIIGVRYERVKKDIKITDRSIQLELNLETELLPYNPTPARIMPYYVRYEFTDSNHNICRLLIEDWEAYSLFWNYIDKYKSTPEEAICKVKEKYESFIPDKDVYFFVGTRFRDHIIYGKDNYYSIISVIYPPKTKIQKEKEAGQMFLDI